MAHREWVESFFRRVWEQREQAAIFELVDEQCVIHGLPGAGPHGPAAFVPFHTLMLGAFTEARITLHDVVEQGDRYGFRAESRWRTADGKELVMTGGGMGRVRDGKLIEAWNQWDFLTMLTQLDGHSEGRLLSTLAELGAGKAL